MNNLLKDRHVYDRACRRWGKITEVDMPFVHLEFYEGPMPKTRVPLRIIGGCVSRFWWDDNQARSDAMNEMLQGEG